MSRSPHISTANLDGTRHGGEKIYVRGELPSPARKRVAIVGARAASRRGLTLAYQLAADLARLDLVVISGGALGIDTAAHHGALDGGGTTVAVLASDVAHPYPARNLPLFDEILRSGGALVSPFSGGTLRRWHFPRRNETLSAMADAVIIVEASATSGSLYTAIAALRLGKPLGACPGTIGTEALLAQGAACVESADDVVAALNGSPRRLQVTLPAEGTDESRALSALDGQVPRDLEVVARLAGLEITRIAQALCALELEGLALPVPGGSYVRSAQVKGFMET